MIMSVGLLATVLPSPAQEKEDSPQVIQVVYEVFSLDRAEAAASQRSLVPDAKLYAKLLNNLKQGKVKQEKLQAIRTVAARAANTKHISEFRYASEYDPPELPNQVGTGVIFFGGFMPLFFARAFPNGRWIGAFLTGPSFPRFLLPTRLLAF